MNFEDISSKFRKISKDTVAEVQKMNEVRQLNAKVNGEKKRITNLYTEIGRKLYELYKDAPLEGFEAEFASVDEALNTVALRQDQIRSVKGVVLCPSCNMEVALTEKFCSNCGCKMPQVMKIEEDGEASVVLDASDVMEVCDSDEEEGAEDNTEAVESSKATNDCAEAVEASEAIDDCAEAAEASEATDDCAAEAAEASEATDDCAEAVEASEATDDCAETAETSEATDDCAGTAEKEEQPEGNTERSAEEGLDRTEGKKETAGQNA